METGWKDSAKKAGWPVLSYSVISLLAVVLAVVRLVVRGEDSDVKVTWWELLQLFFVPALFFAAGYLATAKCGLKKIKAQTAFLAAMIFSALLLGLWYVWLDGYVLCNLPAAECGIAIDLWLRKRMIAYGYEYTYLANTDMYRYAVLPLLHFAVRVLCWMCYLWGNRKAVSRRKSK